jgi:hypothetical protein
MRTARTLLLILLALSLAALPAAGAAPVAAKSIEMSMPDGADMPCCNADQCKDSIACALKCFSCLGAIFEAVVSPRPTADTALRSFAAGALHPHLSSPPTHPPPA